MNFSMSSSLPTSHGKSHSLANPPSSMALRTRRSIFSMGRNPNPHLAPCLIALLAMCHAIERSLAMLRISPRFPSSSPIGASPVVKGESLVEDDCPSQPRMRRQFLFGGLSFLCPAPILGMMRVPAAIRPTCAVLCGKLTTAPPARSAHPAGGASEATKSHVGRRETVTGDAGLKVWLSPGASRLTKGTHRDGERPLAHPLRPLWPGQEF